jgi:hypothetical protein
MTDIAGRDVNRVTSLQALSSVTGVATVNLWANPSTHALLVEGSLSITSLTLDYTDDDVTVYGSQGVALQQKVTTNDLIVTLDGESIAVTGTFWQTTQPVSIAGTLTVQATDLDIRDLTSASDSILIYGSDDGGTTKRVIKTDSFGVIATTSAANSLASGIIDAAEETVECSVSPGAATVGCQLTGTWAAVGDLVTFEATVDGTNWVPTYAGLISSGIVAIISGSNGLYQIGCAGYAKVRVRGFTWGTPASCSVSLNSTVGVSAVNLSTPIPPGSNVIGGMTVADGSDITLGAKADAKSAATDTTAITVMQVLKEISYMEQTPASRAVTNAGTFAVQATLAAETTKVIGTVNQGTSPWVISGAITNADITSCKTALELLDNSVDGNYLNVNFNVAGTDVAANAGTLNAQTLRVTIATDDEVNNLLGTIDTDTGNLVKSIVGATAPTIDSYANAAVSVSANTADQELVAAPGANKQIWVYGISYVVGTAAGTVSFQDSDNTAISGVMDHALNSGMSIPPSGNFSMPIWKLVTNKALEVDTVTCDIEGFLSYAIVSV